MFNINFSIISLILLPLHVLSTTCGINQPCNDPKLCTSGTQFVQSSISGTCVACSPSNIIPGEYCTLGEVELCPAGYYCPLTTALVGPVDCPSGSYCREGIDDPIDCVNVMQRCPSNSSYRSPGVGNLILIILIILFIFLILILFRRWAIRKRKLVDLMFEKRKSIESIVVNFILKISNGIIDANLSKLQGFTSEIRYESPVSVSFNNLSMTLKSDETKCILDGVSGEFPPGSIVAIMGPSGGGKSTFMNAISGRAPYGNVTGDVKINGCNARLEDYPRLVGFVPQDDIMYEDLTVFQNLYYSAMLRLPREMSVEKKKKIVEDVILILDLEAIKHTVVGSPEKRGISGGQKKRVNIGMELVAYPRILFLDEPTSGLDSSASLSVVNCLNRMKSLGITVVCVIHQPRYSIFRSFSHVLLLGKGGRTVYLGDTGGIESYFTDLGFVLPSGENVADWFIDIVSGTVPRWDKTSGDQISSFIPDDLFDLWKNHVIQTENIIQSNPIPNLIYSRVCPTTLTNSAQFGFTRTVSSGSNGIVNSIIRSSGVICKEEGNVSNYSSIVSNGQMTSKSILKEDRLREILSLNIIGALYDEVEEPSEEDTSFEDSGLISKHQSRWLENTELSLTDIHDLCYSLGLQDSLLSRDMFDFYRILFEKNLDGKKLKLFNDYEMMKKRSSEDLETILNTGICSPNDLINHLIETHRSSIGEEEEEEDDKPKSNNYRKEALEQRHLISIWKQSYFYFERAAMQFDGERLTIYLLVGIVAAAIAGAALGKSLDYSNIPVSYSSALLLFTIVLGPASLYLFGQDKVVFHRECSTGISIFAFWLGKTLVNLVDVILMPLVFSAIWYIFTQGDFVYGEAFLVFFLVSLYVNPMTHCFAILFSYSSALLLAVIVPALMVGMFGGTNPVMDSMSGVQKGIMYISTGLYSIELLTIFEIESLPYSVRLLKPVSNMLSTYSFDLDHKGRDIGLLIGLGVIWRLFSLIALYYSGLGGFSHTKFGQKFKTFFKSVWDWLMMKDCRKSQMKRGNHEEGDDDATDIHSCGISRV